MYIFLTLKNHYLSNNHNIYIKKKLARFLFRKICKFRSRVIFLNLKFKNIKIAKKLLNKRINKIFDDINIDE